jgi:hypothetical protein
MQAERIPTIQNPSTKTQAVTGVAQAGNPGDRRWGQTNVEIRAKFANPPNAIAAASPAQRPWSQSFVSPGHRQVVQDKVRMAGGLRLPCGGQRAKTSGKTPRNSTPQFWVQQGKFKAGQ